MSTLVFILLARRERAGDGAEGDGGGGATQREGDEKKKINGDPVGRAEINDWTKIEWLRKHLDYH